MERVRGAYFTIADTYQFIEEDDSGRVSVLAPFHYENQLRPSVSAAYGPGRARRLTQEVSALATSLPLSSSSSVFVRCDENRLDVMKVSCSEFGETNTHTHTLSLSLSLLQVLITGPSDTPYANGCFEFDVLFPETYPQSPMLVNLMTTGHRTVRFNPNLYNDGKVRYSFSHSQFCMHTYCCDSIPGVSECTEHMAWKTRGEVELRNLKLSPGLSTFHATCPIPIPHATGPGVNPEPGHGSRPLLQRARL